MTTGTSPNGPMTLHLNTKVFDRFAELYGWKSDEDIAQAIGGVSREQVRRIHNREQSASVAFIANFLANVPEAGFYETFEIVPTTNREGT